MKVTLELTPELVQTLNDAASEKPMDVSVLRETVRKMIAAFPPFALGLSDEHIERVAGLNAGDIAWISDDFDAPLPDSFWLGDSGGGA